jgi:hypothetical protein
MILDINGAKSSWSFMYQGLMANLKVIYIDAVGTWSNEGGDLFNMARVLARQIRGWRVHLRLTHPRLKRRGSQGPRHTNVMTVAILLSVASTFVPEGNIQWLN